MNLQALRRPSHLGRTSQLTRVRGGRHELPSGHPVPTTGRLVGRWTLAPDGCLVLMWSRERSARSLRTPAEEAMPDPDAGPSHKSRARILGGPS